MLKRAILSVGFVCLIAVAGLSINWMISQSVDQAVALNAERTSELWSRELVKGMPDIEGLINTGVPTDAQRQHIHHILGFGDVFRFKLFDSNARVKIVSDELATELEELAVRDHNGNAADVILSGENLVSLNDGSDKPNRPDIYAEAYLPVFNDDGTVQGVVEVYTDETAASELFRKTTQEMALFLSLIFALGIGLPTLAFSYMIHRVKKAKDRANYLADYDQISNLMNRHGFVRRVDELVAQGKADWSNAAIICIGVDHLNAMNDTHGHRTGDAFLRHIGRAINEVIGDDDLAGRIGGDEFAILRQQSGDAELLEFASALSAAVARPMRRNGEAIVGHVSMGIHTEVADDLSLEKRLKKADLALKQAKLDGRDTFRVFSEELEAKFERHRFIEAAIIEGLAHNRFHVYYQPLLIEATMQCIGFEALLRLDDGSGNMISPAEFIPIAESMGTIKRIGAWVLETATETAAEWPSHLFVSVNLSPRQFDDGHLVPLIRGALARAGIGPKRLELEVTESLLMENAEQVGAQLTELQELGVSIAMDDFGTGYSSLGYLWQFGFDKLKIDRSFILGLDHESAKTREILDTIIMLGHRLDMKVTAEGIENEGQAELLSSLSCDQFQGFLYGKPMPRGELPAFFLKNMISDTQKKGSNLEQAG